MLRRLLFVLIISAISMVCSAKNINLYDQPKADAKVVGTIDSDTGIIPIFTPKDNKAWVKVADPRNGNVGWIKNSDIDTGATSGFTFTQHTISSGKGPGTYQVFQFGTPNQQISPEQAQKMINQIQARQQAIQEDTAKMMQDIYKSMDLSNFPVIMPVIVLPQQNPAPAATTPTKK